MAHDTSKVVIRLIDQAAKAQHDKKQAKKKRCLTREGQRQNDPD